MRLASDAQSALEDYGFILQRMIIQPSEPTIRFVFNLVIDIISRMCNFQSIKNYLLIQIL